LNDRIKRLREFSLNTKARFSTERAELITDFYGRIRGVSAPVRRALAFKYLMENKTICINDGELIVGERGPFPKAVPTYPELCCHSLQDLDVISGRPKVPFIVSAEDREIYQKKIIPFWQSQSMREMIFQEMSSEWKAAYEAGVFTEFMEQRAPGHTVLGDRIYRQGFVDIKTDIEKGLQSLDYLDDPQAHNKGEELKAMSICADAIVRFAERYAEKAREITERESDPDRRKGLSTIVDVCSHVPKYAPRDFWGALQSYWFVHLGVITELNTWDSFSPGRLDQHLYPF